MSVTKCIPDGNCLFHAICNCCYKQYWKLNREEKQKFAGKVRGIVALELMKPDVQRYVQKAFPSLFADEKPEDVFDRMIDELEYSNSLMYYYAHIFAFIFNRRMNANIDFCFVKGNRAIMFEPKKDCLYGIIVVGVGHYDCVQGLYENDSLIIKALSSEKQEK